MKLNSTRLFLLAAIAPAIAFAADPIQPGKSGADSASQPQTTNPQQAPAEKTPGKTITANPAVEGGKSGDAATLPKAPASKFRGTVTAVDKAGGNITVNDEKHGNQVIQVADKTKGVTGAEAASWSELKVGAEVHGVIRKDGEKFYAESLSLGK